MRAFFCLLLVWSQSVAGDDSLPGDDWTLARQEDGISIYTRTIPGQALKAQRGEMVIDSTPEALVALILDVVECEKWVERCIKAELLREPNHLPAQVYTVIKMPWPFSNRDVAFEATFMRRPTSGAVEIRVHDVKGLVAPDPRYQRMPLLQGKWMFTPVKGGRVQVSYEVQADPGGYLPTWIANVTAVGAAYRTLARMRQLAGQPRYRHAQARQLPSFRELPTP